MQRAFANFHTCCIYIFTPSQVQPTENICIDFVAVVEPYIHGAHAESFLLKKSHFRICLKVGEKYWNNKHDMIIIGSQVASIT